MMAVLETGERIGTLSSGCIEADIALHAAESIELGTPKVVRYGRGSPFPDIQLPCGGGLDILILPAPDRHVLHEVSNKLSIRQPCTLEINVETGAMNCHDTGETARHGRRLFVRFLPILRFHIFGKGPEACAFAALTESVGYPSLLLSPDEETLRIGESLGCDTRHLTRQAFPDDLEVDERTAITLFFHDHEWEPPLLSGALKTPAFYIGAQGSKRARQARMLALGDLGVSAVERERLHGPVGLVPSARDPRTLAVSVLAEVLAKAMDAAGP